MGLLDDVLGSLGNGNNQQGHQAGQAVQSDQLKAIWDWVEEQGGIMALLQKFQQGGLGAILGSWLGNGMNQQIGGGEIQSAFGQGELQSLADKLGTDVHGASGMLAGLLPQLIDGMSPRGQLDQQQVQNAQQDMGSFVKGIFDQK